ncbi:MAG: hypothetical protein JO264_13860 [Acidisphaera sp.]|nr:hypothetical protein [Acidisphaera sp.]
MFRILVTAALSALLPAATTLADRVAILAPDASCFDWLTDREVGKVMEDRTGFAPHLWTLETWATGFLTGMAVMQSGSDFLRGLSQEAVYGWLDYYCQTHHPVSVMDALRELAKERGLQ